MLSVAKLNRLKCGSTFSFYCCMLFFKCHAYKTKLNTKVSFKLPNISSRRIMPSYFFQRFLFVVCMDHRNKISCLTQVLANAWCLEPLQVPQLLIFLGWELLWWPSTLCSHNLLFYKYIISLWWRCARLFFLETKPVPCSNASFVLGNRMLHNQ